MMEPRTTLRGAAPEMSMVSIELRELERFIVVIEAQSMTVAAQRLGMTQSAVSQTINSLEQKLGVSLIDRGVRPLTMTVPGRVHFERASHLIDEARSVTQAVRDAAHQSLPSLRLGLVDSFAATVGPHLMHNHVDLTSNWSIWSGLSQVHESALTSRSVDIIVTAGEMGTSEDFERRHLLAEPFILAVPKDAGWAVDSMRALASAHPCIRFSARSFIGQQIERYMRRLKVEIPSRLEFDTSDAVSAMVAAGMGWALTTPLSMLQAIAHIDKIQLLPLPGPKSRRHLTMIYRPNELGELPEIIYTSSIDILKTVCLPRIIEHAPWIEPLLVIGEQDSF